MSALCPLNENSLPYQPMLKTAAIKIVKPIVLVGMMGAGKSAIGKKLAERLECRWIDCDDYIETFEARSISDIFENDGEVAFRALERTAIKKLLAENSTAVISLGGGAFSNAETRTECNKTAITIWLKASAKTIIERIGKTKTNRPLLTQNNSENFKTTINKLLAEREKFYAQAHITIDEDKVENIIKNITTKLRHIELKQ